MATGQRAGQSNGRGRYGKWNRGSSVITSRLERGKIGDGIVRSGRGDVEDGVGVGVAVGVGSGQRTVQAVDSGKPRVDSRGRAAVREQWSRRGPGAANRVTGKCQWCAPALFYGRVNLKLSAEFLALFALGTFLFTPRTCSRLFFSSSQVHPHPSLFPFFLGTE